MKTLFSSLLYLKWDIFPMLLICFLLMINFSKAEIIYQYIDTTISAPLLNQQQDYHLDMNNDGINEYFFNHGNQMGTLVCEIYSEPTSFTNEILVANNIPAMLGYLTEISAISTDWLNTYNGVGTSALYFTGNWPGAIDKFVAVRFKINGSYHYGWIRIEIAADSSYMKIKECAYDDIPGQMIYAGYKSVNGVDEFSSQFQIIINYENGLKINLPFNKNCSFDLYDLSGNIISSEILNDSNCSLNFENLPSGIYFVVIKGDNKIIERVTIMR